MEHKIAVIINYCSNEYRFLKHCVREAKKISQQIVIVLSTHFFDGIEEKKEDLEAAFEQFPECQFVLYPFIPSLLKKKTYEKMGAHFWHSLSRLVGARFLDQEMEYVLFLDADEVLDGDRFKQWLDGKEYQKYQVLRLANYWYFRSAVYQAKSYEDSVVLSNTKNLSSTLLLDKQERIAIYEKQKGDKKREVVGTDGKPLVHHYSWVRTKEELLKKVTSWGHRDDRDWVSLVEEEFSHPFIGIDFVHDYAYKTVKPFIDLDVEEKIPKVLGTSCFSNVHVVSRLELKNILQS